MGSVVSGIVGGASSALTPQNNFQAQNPEVIAQQKALAAQLALQASGQGPNAAQDQYKQNTQNAVSQAAGFAASQKGTNPALAAREAGILGAKTQATAAGGEATLQAQQEQAATQEQAGVLSNIGSEEAGTQNVNAGIAAQNAAATQNTASGLVSGIGAGIGMLFADGGEVPSGDMSLVDPDAASAQAPAQKSPQGSNAPAQMTASEKMANQMLAMAGVPTYDAGNAASKNNPVSSLTKAKPTQLLSGSSMAGGPMDAIGGAGGGADLAGAALLAAKGGQIPEHLHEIASTYHGWTKPGTEHLKAAGGKVPGKAQVKGDSPKNDTVKTMLSPGEVVIPKSVMESKDPVKAGANFIAQELKKQGKSGKSSNREQFESALRGAIGSRRQAA